jgi:hypothetical protein
MTPICLQRFYDSLYSCLYVYGSIMAWMVVTTLLYQCCLSEHIRGAPYLDSQFIGWAGTAAVLAVTVSLILVRPECHCSVSCPSDLHIAIFYVIPAFQLGVGILCWVVAWNRRQLARQVSNDVFTKVPDTEEEELELTEVDEENEDEEETDEDGQSKTNGHTKDNGITGGTVEDHVL